MFPSQTPPPTPTPPVMPPLAVVLIFTPATGQIQIQWPPQLPLHSVQGLLLKSLETIDNMIAAKNGGIIKATDLP